MVDSSEGQITAPPSSLTGEERVQRLEDLLKADESVFACGGAHPKETLNIRDFVLYYTHVNGNLDEEGNIIVPEVGAER